MSAKKTILENELEKYEKLFNEMKEFTLKEIDYSREQLQLDLEHLKQWLKDQHHLPECRLKENDNFLLTYLAGCKGSMEKVKRKLDIYYSVRGKSQIYRDRDPLDENYRKMSDIWCQNAVLKPTDNATVVFLARLSDKLEEIPQNAVVNIFKRSINLIEVSTRLVGIVNKIVILIDFGRYPATMAALYTPALLKDVSYLVENAFPLRIQKMIFFNVAPFIDFLINSLIIPFQNKKLKERIVVTSKGYEEISKYIDTSVLPKDWQGGYPLTFEEVNDAFNEYEIVNRDMFINELSEEVKESKRIDTGVKYILEDSLFGVQGSLKKLAID